MKAKYINWYLRMLEREVNQSSIIYSRLQTRSFLTEEEVVELMNSNRRLHGYVRQMREYAEFDAEGWRYRLFHRREKHGM